jgi:hypothetical protein
MRARQCSRERARDNTHVLEIAATKSGSQEKALDGFLVQTPSASGAIMVLEAAHESSFRKNTVPHSVLEYSKNTVLDGVLVTTNEHCLYCGAGTHQNSSLAPGFWYEARACGTKPYSRMVGDVGFEPTTTRL